MQSKATTVAGYLAELPEARRAVVSAVRAVIRENLPDGYEENLAWGMITYSVPLSRYPDTYNKQPLGYVSLAAQARHYALYLCTLYMDKARAEAFTRDFREHGKKLDMGKSCVRFKKLEDLHLPTVAAVVASTPVDAFIALYEKSRHERGSC